MTGLGALRHFYLDHLHLGRLGLLGEFVGIEVTGRITAAEIAGADFPDQVAAVFAVIGRDRALAGVMREAAHLRPTVQCAYRVRRQRPETHCRDVEDRGLIRLLAVRPADGDPEALRVDVLRRRRVAYPFAVAAIDGLDRAEAALVVLALGARIDHRTLVARERQFVFIALEEVLADLGTNVLEHEAQVARDRVIAQDRMMFLTVVAPTENEQSKADQRQPRRYR